jgi:hypothetical protein
VLFLELCDGMTTTNSVDGSYRSVCSTTESKTGNDDPALLSAKL